MTVTAGIINAENFVNGYPPPTSCALQASALLAALTVARTAAGATGSKAKGKAEKALARLAKLPVPDELRSALGKNPVQNSAELLQPQQVSR